ncbi:hypothetical protein DF020_05650 [Burkholderia cenocepacia]|nr:hypothetical protein DF020_05650 [Burkholderia cenocepacia]
MTDRRYVFQRPAEAARLHARRRYAVRPALRAGRTRGHPACLPFAPRGAGRRRCGPLRDARATSFIRMSPSTENSRMTQFNRSPSRAAATAARPSRHD